MGCDTSHVETSLQDGMEAANLKTGESEAERLRRQGDKIIVGALWFLSVYSFAIDPWLGTWFEAVAIGFPAAVIPKFLAG
jgi:hypothetical protein